MPLEHSTLSAIKRVRLVLVVLISRRLANSNVLSVQLSLVELVSLLDQEPDPQLIVKSVAQLASSLIRKVDFVVRADMVSINHKRAHLDVISVDLAKQLDWPKLHLVQSAATNALPVNNLAPMDGVNPVRVVHSACRECNQHALPVQSVEQRPRLEPHLLRNARSLCAHRVHS